MGINRAFEVTIGDKDSWLFRGSAKKIVITSAEGVPIRVWDQTKSRAHNILCNPKASKTIRPYSGMGGPRRIVARTRQKGATARVLVQVEEVVFEGNDPIMVSTQDLQDILTWLRSNGFEV